MAKGIISQLFTFTALFLDSTGNPTAVTTPTIEVFYYNATGVKTSVVAAGTVLAVSLPAETGRYAYSLTVSETYTPRIQLYGVLQGIDPVSGDNLVVEREVDLFNEDTDSSITTSFVKAGAC